MADILGSEGTGDTSRLDDKIRALEDVIRRAAFAEEGVKSTLDRLEERLTAANQLKLDLESLQQSVQEVSERSRTTDKELSGFKDRSDRDMRAVEDDMKRTNDSIRLINTQIEQSKATLGRLDKAEQQLVALERTIKDSEKVRTELSTASKTVQDFLRHRGELEKSLSSLDSSLSRITSQLGDAEKRSQQVTAQVESQTGSASARAEQLQKQLDDVNSRFAQISTFQNELDQYKNRLEEVNRQVAPLSDMGKQVEELAGRITTMQTTLGSLESSKAEVGSLVDNINKATMEMSTLAGRISTAQEILAQVEGLRDRVAGIQTSVDDLQKMKSDIATLGTNLGDYENRWRDLQTAISTQEQMGTKITTELDTLKQQADLFKSQQENEQNTALERSGKAASQLADIEQRLSVISGMESSVAQLQQKLVDFESRTAGMSQISTQIADLNTKLDGFITTGKNLEATIAKADGDRTSLEEHLTASGTKMMDLNGKVESVTTAVDAMNIELQKVSDKCQLYADVADRADKLDITIEFIQAKLAEISNTRAMLEQASAEHSRLNALLWEMDGRMRKLKQEQELLQSSESNLAKVESILETIAQKEGQIKEISDLMVKGENFREALDATLAATDSQIQFFKGIQTGIPAIEQKYDSIKTELGSIEERQKILYDEQDRLRIQGMELERQRTELEAVTKLAQEVVPLTQTLNDLDARTKDVALKLEGLTEKVSLLGTADLKIGELEQKLKIVIERSASLRQELNRIENLEKEVTEYEKGHDAFVSKANIYEDHAQGLVKQMTEIDELLTKKQVDVRMVFEEIVKKITEVKTIESNISVLEDKFTRLMQMREELDQSLTVTIDRSSVIDRYHIRLDNFKIMVDELGSRIDRIVKEIPRMDTVEKDLAGLFDELKTLNTSIASATTDIKNVEAEKQDIQTKFSQLVEIRNSFDKEMKAVETRRTEMTTMMKELDSLWKDISEKAVDGEKAQEQLRIYEDRMSAISFLYDDINYRFGEINRLATRLKSMEENMTKVDGYMDLLKAEFIKVNEDMSKVDVAISSINGVNEKSQGMEERFRKIERYLEELEKGMDGSEELRSMLRQLRVDIDEQRAELISLEGIESKITELRNELMRMEERSASVERGADRLEVAFRKIAMLSMAMDAVQAQQSGATNQ